MKKYLCYDTNDAASGRVNVDRCGMLRPNSTVPSTNGAAYQHLVTDSTGTAKWEDRKFGYTETIKISVFNATGVTFNYQQSTEKYKSATVNYFNADAENLIVTIDDTDFELIKVNNLNYETIEASPEYVHVEMVPDIDHGVFHSYIYTSISGNIHNIAISKSTNIIKTIPEDYFPKTIKSDWDQNDNESLNYVKNRTHFLEVGVIKAATTMDVQYGGGQYTVSFSPDSYSYSIDKNSLIRMKINNEYFESKCKYVDGTTTTGTLYFGNYSKLNSGSGQSDTGESYVLAVNYNYSSVSFVLYLYDNYRNLTSIDIEVDKLIHHKLSQEYIPALDSIVLKSTTTSSTKQFRITVDDSGTISATEV